MDVDANNDMFAIFEKVEHKPGTSFLEQGKFQCRLLIALLKVDRPAKELEVAHDVLVVHDHLASRQQTDLPVVVLEAATAKCSGIPQSL